MSASQFGSRFQVHTFGESHGVALGVVIDGCPAGLEFDFEFLRNELQRRRPGAQTGTSTRQEMDEPEVLSGIFEGKTLGTPIAIIVRNNDARSKDYEEIKNAPRAGHADDVWKLKFGHSDHRGGGRSSGRETVARVMAGAVAKMLLKKLYTEFLLRGFASQIGPEKLALDEKNEFLMQRISADSFSARYPSKQHEKIRDLLLKAQAEGESFGGIAEIRVQGMPKGLGQPVFHKIKADLASAVMGIGAVSSVSFGDDNEAHSRKGTDFHQQSKQSQYGGIRGGITTGEDLIMNVEFKPTSSILDVAKKGRHDPCIVPRAIPVIESMVALVLADHALWARQDRL